MNTKTKSTFMVMFGGGIGECQSTRNVTTPLAAIKQWVRGQNPNGKYTAPMDTWIHPPSYFQKVEGRSFSDDVLDVEGIRKFYQWILDNRARLARELDKQSVYHVYPLTDRACEYAEKYLAMSDEELRGKFDMEALSPFTGG